MVLFADKTERLRGFTTRPYINRRYVYFKVPKCQTPGRAVAPVCLTVRDRDKSERRRERDKAADVSNVQRYVSQTRRRADHTRFIHPTSTCFSSQHGIFCWFAVCYKCSVPGIDLCVSARLDRVEAECSRYVRSSVMWTWYFEKKTEWTDFAANWHNCSTGQRDETRNFGGQEAEVRFRGLAEASFLISWVE